MNVSLLAEVATGVNSSLLGRGLMREGGRGVNQKIHLSLLRLHSLFQQIQSIRKSLCASAERGYVVRYLRSCIAAALGICAAS